MNKILRGIGLTAAMLFYSSTAGAYFTFFGEDLHDNELTPIPAFPNAAGAETDFLNNLTGVGTEDFEGFADNTSEPLNLSFPGAGTATLSGGGGSVQSVPAGMTNDFGRYGTSPTNYFEVDAGGDFLVTLSDLTAAFGFFGIDIGDFGGQLQLEIANTLGGGVIETLTVSNTQGSSGSTGGSVLYFGFIAENAGEQFNQVKFSLTNTTLTTDVFAFDDFTIGSLEQVVTPPTTPPSSEVPEPGTVALLGMGLMGLMLAGRRRRHRQ